MIDRRRARVLVSFAVLVLLLLSGGMLHDQDVVPVLLSEMPVGELALADPGNPIVDHPEPVVASVLVRRPVSRGPPA